MKNKKILITGASGFVGSNAVKYFLKKGARIRAIVSPLTGRDILERQLGGVLKDIEIVKADLLNPNESKNAAQSQEIILNFAAVDGSLEYKKIHSAEMFSQNTRINLNMLEASVANENTQSFLCMSSSDIYSYQDKGKITERSAIEINWEKEIDGYKLAKYLSELASREFVKQYGINVIILRPGNLYGPGDDFEEGGKIRFIPSVIRKVLLGSEPVILWGDGTQSRPFLYIDDFLIILEKLILKKAFNRPINIASTYQHSLKEVAETVFKLCKKEIEITTDLSKPAGAHSRVFDLSLMKVVVGSQDETDFEEGLRTTIDYFRKYYLK